ncbi:MAG: sulfite oxidase-like oxidoreductase [Candidatus Dojkabacteria bacterium]|nr:MAG: sulfite oxidase-like oxidoreductase [Candidatus Dojkabacteria bacterium]
MGLTQFIPKRDKNDRLPPGQYLTDDFPILSYSLTPEVSAADWRLEIAGVAKPHSLSLDELIKLGEAEFQADIHCVTKWSKLDTNWKGVSLDKIIEISEVSPDAAYLIAYSYDDYTTNLPLIDLRDGKAFIAYEYNGKPLDATHGGPVRLVVPHLYFWKSAKWLKKIEFTKGDQQGFWERHGYHNYGDPWKEQRYNSDI